MKRREVLGAAAGLAAASVTAARARGAAYAPLGRVEIEGAAEAVVGDGGRTAFVATTDGFATVDLSDPAAPAVLAERRDLLADREDGPMEDVLDVKVDGDRLLVAGPANPRRDTIRGFALYDVSDPAAPDRVAFHGTEAPVHNAFLGDGVAYLTQEDPVVMVDVADDDPEEVGRFSVTDHDSRWSDVIPILRSPHDLWVGGGIAYVARWEAGTWLVDVSDPSSPRAVGHVEARPFDEVADIPFDEAGRELTGPPGNHHYVQPSADGDLLAIGKESWDAESGDDAGGPSGIELWDVSEPSEPIQLSEIHPPRAEDETRRGTWTTSHNFDLVGDRLFSSWYQGGVKVHDVSDPSEPAELAWWRDPDVGAFWTANLATDGVFAASSAGQVSPSVTEGLFTFPTAPGEQADPPSTPAPATAPSSMATPRPTPTPTPTETPTPTPTETPTPTPTETPTPAGTDGQPGLGFLAGLSGVAAGAWWLLRGGNADR